MIRTRFILTTTLIAGALLLIGAACDELITETIEITTAGHPTADFTISPDAGCTPLVVTFDDASSGPVAQWIWNFGDGDTAVFWKDSGHDGGVTHTYDSIGSYTVVLTVLDTLDGSDAESKNRAVVADHNIDGVELSDTLICPGDSITFTARNTTGITIWRWEFGDLDVSSDTDSIQVHAYSSPGVYGFELTVTGECGQTVLHDTVHVLPCAGAMFERLDTGNWCVPFTAQFLDMSTPPLDDTGAIAGSIIEWEWTFGDGHRQTYNVLTDTVYYDYEAEGIYEVMLMVTTDSGGVTTYVDTVVAYPSVLSNFSAAPTEGCHTPGRQFVVAFQREATGDTAWVWDFGDGDSAFTQNAYHAYTDPGVYTVTLEAFGACGAISDKITREDLIVYSDQLDSAQTAVTMTRDRVEFTVINDTVTDTTYWYIFEDVSPPAAVVFWEWDFGDESVHSFLGPSVEHEFDNDSTFDIQMIRRNTCDTIVIDTPLVIPPPTK